MAVQKIPLMRQDSPVRLLAKAYPSGNVWLKNDAMTAALVGGNKVRKLEYLLWEAKRHRREVLTFGFESSNHAVATAYYCRELGLGCHFVLVRGPGGLSERDERSKNEKMSWLRSVATSVFVVEGFQEAVMKALWLQLRHPFRYRVIPPGGSSPLGTLGYVDAGGELASQVGRGELPVPHEVHLPLGTGGTAVGLAIGLARAGLPCRVVACKVVPGSRNELPALRKLARQVQGTLCESADAPFALENLSVEHGVLGGGYGMPIEDAIREAKRVSTLERIAVDDTYTGKTLLSVSRASQDPERRILFWNTYSPFSSSTL